jgi:hypothetical protein
MRTTLDIDDDVLQVVKDVAAARKDTAGKVLSDLAREALTRPRSQREIIVKDGFPLLKGTGAVVTPELVERLLDRADLEDAGIKTD